MVGASFVKRLMHVVFCVLLFVFRGDVFVRHGGLVCVAFSV